MIRQIRTVRLCCGLLLVVLVQPVSAQLSTSGPAEPAQPWSQPQAVVEMGYDPAHDVYLAISNDYSTGALRTTGIFLNSVGSRLTSPFTIFTGVPTEAIRAAYSPDLSDGAGGAGGFLVIQSGGDVVLAQIVAFPGRLVGTPVRVSGTEACAYPCSNFAARRIAVAYSDVNRVFLVAWHGEAQLKPQFVLLNLDAATIGPAIPLAFLGFCNPYYPYSCDEVHAVWNPTTFEFGVLYTDAQVLARIPVLARVRGDGTIVGRTQLSSERG